MVMHLPLLKRMVKVCTVTTTKLGDVDTIIYNKGINISEFTLPISYKHPEDVLVFSFDNSTSDMELHVTACD